MKKKWMLIVTVCFMILFGCQAVMADNDQQLSAPYAANLEIGPASYLACGSTVTLYGTAEDTEGRDAVYRYIYYDGITWREISKSNAAGSVTWKPEAAGEYLVGFQVQYQGQESTVYASLFVQEPFFEISRIDTAVMSDGETVGIAPRFQTNWPASYYSFKYLIYDLEQQKWTTLRENAADWCEWKPEKPGSYWIHVVATNIYGEETACTIGYYVQPPYVNASNIQVSPQSESEIWLNMDVESNEEVFAYRWMYYDLSTGYWGMIRDWSTVKEAAWFPPKFGSYWIHGEAQTVSGVTGSVTIGYQVSPYEYQLTNMQVYTPDYKTYYIQQNVVTNDPNVSYVYQIYDLQTQKWTTLGTGHNTYWQPTSSGTYWIHAIITGSNGSVYTNTVAYGIQGYRIGNFGFSGKLEPGVPAQLSSDGWNFLNEGYTISYWQWNGNGWEWLYESNGPGSVTWTPGSVGDYRFYCRVMNAAGYVVDSRELYISSADFAKDGWYYEDGYKFYYINGEKQLDLDGILPRQDSYIAMINRTTCTVTIYAKDGDNGYIIPVKRFACSVGLPSTPTPTGTYRTLAKYRWHELMGPSWGQYCTRIVGGVLFHSVAGSNTTSYNLNPSDYNMLGSPASHGCVRLCVRDAKWIYDNCKLGMQVTIYDSSWPGPLGQGEVYRITDPNQNWDPTDPNV